MADRTVSHPVPQNTSSGAPGNPGEGPDFNKEYAYTPTFMYIYVLFSIAVSNGDRRSQYDVMP